MLIETYSFSCDNCGHIQTLGAQDLYGAAEILEQAYDWEITRDAVAIKHYCSDCVSEDGEGS